MAKLEQIHRLLYIAELLKNKPNGITYEATKEFLEEKFQEKGFELKFSEKTPGILDISSMRYAQYRVFSEVSI